MWVYKHKMSQIETLKLKFASLTYSQVPIIQQNLKKKTIHHLYLLLETVVSSSYLCFLLRSLILLDIMSVVLPAKHDEHFGSVEFTLSITCSIEDQKQRRKMLKSKIN